MAKFIEMDACDLDRIIKSVHGKEFEVPCWMETQRLVKVYGIEKTHKKDKAWTERKIQAWLDDNWVDNGSEPNTIDFIMCDLVSRGKLKPGDYLLEFSD